MTKRKNILEKGNEEAMQVKRVVYVVSAHGHTRVILKVG